MEPNVIKANEADFQEVVLNRSHQMVVLVDFWAPWCGPCRMLTPILEELAASASGKWVLAKVNIDENPALAQRFQVQGIPNVKAFRDGKVVGEFTGVQPRNAIERFLNDLVPNQLDEKAREAAAMLDRGDLTGARQRLEAVLQEKRDHEEAHLAMARLELEEGNVEEALRHLSTVPSRGANGAEAERLRARAGFANAPAEDLETLQMQVESNPENLEYRYDLALKAAKMGDYELAAEQLFHILERDLKFREGEAHKQLLHLFVLMGEEDARTRKYRQRLGWLLFA